MDEKRADPGTLGTAGGKMDTVSPEGLMSLLIATNKELFNSVQSTFKLEESRGVTRVKRGDRLLWSRSIPSPRKSPVAGNRKTRRCYGRKGYALGLVKR